MSAVAAECVPWDRASTVQETEFDAFAGQLAHELLTPIGQIGAIAQLLLDGKSFAADERTRTWLGLLVDASRLSDETVHALLDLARSRVAVLRRETVELSALSLQLFDELMPMRGRRVVRNMVQPAICVWAEPRLMRILMRNLLSNAAKYTRDVDTAFISVTAVVNADGSVQVEVSDNGAGFDAHCVGRLFHPFERGHTQEQFPGCGLGLSIAWRIVERHGGAVRVASTPGLGTTVCFTLPAQPDAVASKVGG